MAVLQPIRAASGPRRARWPRLEAVGGHAALGLSRSSALPRPAGCQPASRPTPSHRRPRACAHSRPRSQGQASAPVCQVALRAAAARTATCDPTLSTVTCNWGGAERARLNPSADHTTCPPPSLALCCFAEAPLAPHCPREHPLYTARSRPRQRCPSPSSDGLVSPRSVPSTTDQPLQAREGELRQPTPACWRLAALPSTSAPSAASICVGAAGAARGRAVELREEPPPPRTAPAAAAARPTFPFPRTQATARS